MPPSTGEELFRRARAERRATLPTYTAEVDLAAAQHGARLAAFRRDGFLALRGYVRPELAGALAARVDDLARRGRHLLAPARVADLAPDRHWSTAPRLAPDVVARGEAAFRDTTNGVSIADPLLQCPAIVDVALDGELLDLVGGYLGCLPMLGFVKLRKAFANGLPAFDTEEFHVDGNSTSLVKAFLYLHGTDETSGAHCFVRGSHRRPLPGWDVQQRADDATLRAFYGAERMHVHRGRAGDLILEDTSGFHRGLKPVAGDRRVLILNYVVHDEYGGGGARTRIAHADWERLDEKQRAAAALLVPTPAVAA